MKLLEKLTKNTAVAARTVARFVAGNVAELYTMMVLFIVMPAIVGCLATVTWGLLLSFVIQAVVGVLYIRGRK